MSAFSYRGGVLHAESVPLPSIAKAFGTPCYVYSRNAIETAYREYEQACQGRESLICFAVKANSNIAILGLLAQMGAGFDIVSGGELARVLAAAGTASKTLFSGVGKTESEIRTALEANILCFNVESEQELERIDRVARAMGRKAPVSMRVNPDVDAKTHPYISTGLRENKFGVAYEDAPRLYLKAAEMPGINITGIDFHIGSQLTEVSPFAAALDKVLEFVDSLAVRGIKLSHIDVGGGLGIRYNDEAPPKVNEYLSPLLSKLGERKLKVLVEPGRSLVGNAGVLLSQVQYIKQSSDKNFVVVDAAMNDLMRPALYEAWHDIVPVITPPAGNVATYDIVGPVCESGDWLGRARDLSVTQNDLLAIMSAGAYGMSMASNYNSRPRPAEVMVDGDKMHLIRPRETTDALFASERKLPA
jgi:diaminopimelate decarboxylase